ncbi:unnamed protein product [Lepeophtheirus salmonis]|uniref:(salmon louse) hypothetical protein n=1 Tax=Lepeophtheirus salmonis TaxID=72036 RepID=A0A7R8CQP1_LEPSM|nr:unnamed protein product [Lepeophtheirus salmonis]CAF2863005.1 unnamed protein product [Lepeophtheirus salmonis]
MDWEMKQGTPIKVDINNSSGYSYRRSNFIPSFVHSSSRTLQQKAFERQNALEKQKAIELQKDLERQKAHEQKKALERQKAIERPKRLLSITMPWRGKIPTMKTNGENFGSHYKEICPLEYISSYTSKNPEELAHDRAKSLVEKGLESEREQLLKNDLNDNFHKITENLADAIAAGWSLSCRYFKVPSSKHKGDEKPFIDSVGRASGGWKRKLRQRAGNPFVELNQKRIQLSMYRLFSPKGELKGKPETLGPKGNGRGRPRKYPLVENFRRGFDAQEENKKNITRKKEARGC